MLRVHSISNCTDVLDNKKYHSTETMAMNHTTAFFIVPSPGLGVKCIIDFYSG